MLIAWAWNDSQVIDWFLVLSAVTEHCVFLIIWDIGNVALITHLSKSNTLKEIT